MRSSFRVLAGLLVMVLVATACGSGGGPGGEAHLKAFTAQLKEPVDLIPGGTNEVQGSAITSLVFAGLTSYNDMNGEPVNLVAKSIRSSNQKDWTVKLRSGWSFSNGEPVTAESFVGAWNTTVRNGWRNAYFFTDLLQIKGAKELGPKTERTEMAGLRVVDDTTFQIKLDQPNSNLPLVLGYTAFYPMPESVLRSKDWKKFREKPIGNGQYMMAEPWKHDDYIKLAKNPDYAGPEKGRADEITFKIYANPVTAYSDAVAGNIDVTQVPPARLISAPKDFPEHYLTTPGSTFVYLGLPLWLDEYKDIRVRRALSMAIDREQISSVLFNKTVTPAKGLVSPLIKLGRREDPCGADCKFDPVKAKRLFEQAGGVKGNELTLWFDTGAGNEDWIEAVANQLRRNLGVTVKLSGQDWAHYPDITNDHKTTGPYRLGWIMDYPSVENYLGPLYGSAGSSNGTGYKNREVDELLTKGNSASSPENGVPFYHKAEDEILDDLPVIPLWFQKSPYVYSDKVSNLTYDSLGYLKYDQVEVSTG